VAGAVRDLKLGCGVPEWGLISRRERWSSGRSTHATPATTPWLR